MSAVGLVLKKVFVSYKLKTSANRVPNSLDIAVKYSAPDSVVSAQASFLRLVFPHVFGPPYEIRANLTCVGGFGVKFAIRV